MRVVKKEKAVIDSMVIWLGEKRIELLLSEMEKIIGETSSRYGVLEDGIKNLILVLCY